MRNAIISRATIDQLAQLAQVVCLGAGAIDDKDTRFACRALCRAVAALHSLPDVCEHPPTDRCPPPDDECPATTRDGQPPEVGLLGSVA